MTQATSITEMYNVTGAVLESSTGRIWWRERGMQGKPAGAYVTLFFEHCTQLENGVVETAQLITPDDDGNTFRQVHWGTSLWECRAMFYKDQNGDSVQEAAMRFMSALRMEARFDDMWKIMGMVGAPRYLDISAIFRTDTEQRAEVRWGVYANVAGPLPLADTGLQEIRIQPIVILHDRVDDVETQIDVEVINPIDESS